ncbi:hypothetical protein [Colwellia sp. Arc7-D]|uniref:hypothetical protein n=1 Tax=Colwellia sp. Arc7-D TaxID=2161872 RepID=UPI000D398D50|nr:hypothetical protein [Colwellia sp. Arc7-D]AWB57852.1 hypothetical protein DBO93_09895 [Colwellia sp. Arc7-D]
MNDEKFTRALQSVGQACFVKYFTDFSSSTKSNEDIVETLKSDTNYTDKSCLSRTGHAQRIIRAGMATKALNTIISSTSPRVSEETRQLAREHLKNLA